MQRKATGPTIEKKLNVQIAKCKQQGGEYGPRNANKGDECNILPMGPIRQEKPKDEMQAKPKGNLKFH